MRVKQTHNFFIWPRRYPLHQMCHISFKGCFVVASDLPFQVWTLGCLYGGWWMYRVRDGPVRVRCHVDAKRYTYVIHCASDKRATFHSYRTKYWLSATILFLNTIYVELESAYTHNHLFLGGDSIDILDSLNPSHIRHLNALQQESIPIHVLNLCLNLHLNPSLKF